MTHATSDAAVALAVVAAAVFFGLPAALALEGRVRLRRRALVSGCVLGAGAVAGAVLWTLLGYHAVA